MDKKNTYNSWPIGMVPKELQRPELEEIKKLGYNWNDPRDVIHIFEKKVASFTGSKFAVTVDCCTNGLFLCLKYLKASGTIKIPKRTYVSVPMMINQAGCKVEFVDKEWQGLYKLDPFNVYDSAIRWTKDMYVGNDALQVISFQIKKRIPIGRGGIILTDNEQAYEWLKLARYDGRDMSIPYEDPNHIKSEGYHMYMTPEDAARGIILMDKTPEVNEDSGKWHNYPDLTEYHFFKGTKNDS